jgi:hypothetical protein
MEKIECLYRHSTSLHGVHLALGLKLLEAAGF